MRRIICFKSLQLLLPVAVLMLSGFAVHAQNSASILTVSPYSRFGIGDFQSNGGLINTAMAGGGIGMRNDSLIPQYINLQNPAAFTSHGIISYEIGMVSNTVKLRNATETGTFNRTTLDHFALAFPVTKWWGLGFGMVPYSQVGYNVSTSDEPVGIGPVTYKYEGSGGINQAFLSNAFRPFAGAPRKFLLSAQYDRLRLAKDTLAIQKKLRGKNALANISVGVNSSWLFGTLSNVRRDVFPDSLNTFNTKISKSTTLRDFYLNYGIQYTFRARKSLNPEYVSMADSTVLSKSWFKGEFVYRTKSGTDTADLWVKKPGVRITYGLTFSLPTDVNAYSDLLAATYKQVGTRENIRDTIAIYSEIPTRLTLPAMVGFGVSLKKDNKWMLQADWMTQLWKQSAFGGENLGLKNSMRITGGIQYQPKAMGTGKFFGVTQYRIGARYYKTYLEIKGTQLTETSGVLSFSFQLPTRPKQFEPVSRGTLSFEYGFRGTTANQLIREDFIRVTVGISINDRWFQRYKYQ
ncbi:MAG TPA: hypothetical protein VI731_03005 [Bacteroidia bacterium]|nr:hypothetical protein [Bacteroidia bacterium]